MGMENEFEQPRSAYRLRYEAEVNLIRRKRGDLEQIRSRLGLSRRQICQLLLVDPSAWTRWSRKGEAPPHVYRALEWYLTLCEGDPAFEEIKKQTISLNTKSNNEINRLSQLFDGRLQELQTKLNEQQFKFEKKLRQAQRVSLFLMMSVVTLIFSLVLLVLK